MTQNNDNLIGKNSREKYFDIIFTANRSLVEEELFSNLKKIATLELLLEEVLGEEKNIAQIIQNYMVENSDKIMKKQSTLFSEGMDKILMKNE